MQNCSSSGMQFYCDQYLEPGSQVMISPLANGRKDGTVSPSLRFDGVVRWCLARKAGGFSTGIQYSDRTK
jgi:hypothetical protein